MATYQAYAEYKDSGVEWLEVIPSHWTSIAIKFLALDKNSLFLDGDWIESKDISDSGIRYITTGNVGTGFYKEQGSGFITEFTFKKLSCSEVYAGDILISRLNLPIGRACIVPDLNNRIVTSVDNVIFRPDEEYHPKFLVYLFSSKEYFQNTENIARGATMQRISRGLLGNIRVVMPSKDEQTQIANFLDHETAKIDHLIEKQQQLIELLKEKRQAVISHAVTKGLNPNVPMKDSGVAWLGEVPEHWGRSAIKNLCYVNDGNHGEEYPKEADFVEENEGVPFIRAGDFDNFQIISNNLRYLSHEKNNSMRKGRLQENDILFVNRGATIGKLCIIDKDYAGSNLNSQIAYLRANKNSVDYRYLTYLLSSAYIQTKIASDIQGGALPQYPIQNIVNLDIWFGDLKEQTMIADYLDHQVQSIICLINKCESAIQLMQERRTALISAAVTGKIDVRNWQAPTVAEADTEFSA